MKFLVSVFVTFALLMCLPVASVADTGTTSGVVAESMESGGYVYIRLEDGVWIAASSFAVTKGDKIQYGGAMEMNDFHSKTLDRTFESILFVSEAGLVRDDGNVDTPVTLPGNANHDKKSDASAAPAKGDIKPLAEGKTIAEIYLESDELNEKVVSVNAKVTKVNRNILGKNWITLQDGTGTQPDHKLVATSKQVVTPGDIMIVKGKVKTEVDLGRGYHYKVLLEEAEFSPGLE